MELKDLCGEHMLSGVDFASRTVSRYGRREKANSCRFRLDGKTYAAVEDADDGYRSSMSDLLITDERLTNEWEPVRVACSMASDTKRERNDILEIRDVVTGGVVLRVGTENTGDYYPVFVSEFTPEALSHNAPPRSTP